MAELDKERIAAAALKIADERGPTGFTMRAIAEALGVTPMALYHHVDGKAALVALLVDAVVGEVPVPEPTGSWQEDLWQLSNWMRRMAQAHPAVSHLRRKYQVWTPKVLPVTERWFSVWQQSGLDLDTATRAAVSCSMAIVGVVEEELRFQEMVHPNDEMLALLPNTRFAFQGLPDRDAQFELVVRALIEGLHARLTRTKDA